VALAAWAELVDREVPAALAAQAGQAASGVLVGQAVRVAQVASADQVALADQVGSAQLAGQPNDKPVEASGSLVDNGQAARSAI